MAPAKRKKKPASFGPPSPNVALIVFVIIFFLGCVGLGLVVYDNHKKKEGEKAKLKEATDKIAEAEKLKEWYKLQYYWTKNRIGHPLASGTTPDEKKFLDE